MAPVPLIPFARAIRHWAERDPFRPAITDETRTITRGELERRTNQLARAYAARGVTPDRFVTIGLPNSVEFLEAVVATWKLGATPQPVSHRLPRAEREAIVELADPALVVGTPESTVAGRPAVPAGFVPDPGLADTPLPDAIATAWKAPTSGGSTGRPKLIVAGTPATIDLAEPALFQMHEDGCLVIPGPLAHNGPFSSSCLGLLRGNHVVLLSRFDPVATLEAVARHRADWLYLVPTMMLRIWRLPEAERRRFDLSSLRAVWHMAAPCPDWLKQAWIDWLGPERIFELYGGTEAQAFTVITGAEWLTHRGSVGRVYTGELCVLGPAGEPVPTGTVGEVHLRRLPGTPPTYRYVGAAAKQRGDWESLGDMGWLDAEGYLYLTDRQTDMILVGGANVYPAEVEAALDAHPRVRSSAVIGLPDEDLGSRVHAIVQADGAVADDELVAFLRDRLAPYKVPRSFERTSAPLRDDAGKVRRSALRAERLAGPRS
jgi:bile acid-coenzyme A ligase